MKIETSHPFLVLSNDLVEICKPLEMFHIHHFTYIKKFNDGAVIALSNKPQWIYDYYMLDLFQSSLFEKKPSDYEASFKTWFGDYDLKVYQHGRQYYHTTDSITITESGYNSCEHYLFSTSPGHQQAIHYLENNRDILYRFILFLKDRGITIFKRAQNHKLNLLESFEPKQENSYNITKEELQKLKIAKENFIKNTPIYQYKLETANNNIIKLTQREILCISYLLKGRTAKETGKFMNISSRTVESYLDNIKIKLDCHNKLELIKKLQNNNYLASI